MKDWFLDTIAYGAAVYRLTKAQLFCVFTHTILYFSGYDDDEGSDV